MANSFSGNDMKKPGVLMIGPDRSVHGGISGVVNNLYDAGLDTRVRLKYIGTMKEGTKLKKLGTMVLAYFQFLAALPGYRIVHVNMASDSSYLRKSVFVRTAKLFGKSIVIHQHGGDIKNYYAALSPKAKQTMKKTLSMADAFLVLAPSWKTFFSQMVPEEKITVLPNSIKVPDAFEKEYGSHKILFLGRLCEAKGIQELFHVMKRIEEKIPDVHLYLGGLFEDDNLRRMMEQDADHITFLGWIGGEDKNRWLKECDTFVLPSYFEGQPVSVLEAMAYRCAVVVTNVGGIPNMIVHGETGILVEPKDEESLYEGLMQVLTDSEKAAKLADSAQQKIEKEFSIAQSVDRLVGLYEGIM